MTSFIRVAQMSLCRDHKSSDESLDCRLLEEGGADAGELLSSPVEGDVTKLHSRFSGKREVWSTPILPVHHCLGWL